jgi:hypothetical protein
MKISSSSRNQTQSPFLRLPAELRNQIYVELFLGYEIDPRADRAAYPRWRLMERRLRDPPVNGRDWIVHWSRASLFRTCRQIYSDTGNGLMLLRNAHFRLYQSVPFNEFAWYLTTEQRDAISTVRIDLECDRAILIELSDYWQTGWWAGAHPSYNGSFLALNRLPALKQLVVEFFPEDRHRPKPTREVLCGLVRQIGGSDDTQVEYYQL